jgi:hypothetical protein
MDIPKNPPVLLRQTGKGVDWEWVHEQIGKGNHQVLEYCRKRRQKLINKQKFARKQKILEIRKPGPTK